MIQLFLHLVIYFLSKYQIGFRELKLANKITHLYIQYINRYIVPICTIYNINH